MTPSVKGFSVTPAVARLRQHLDEGSLKQETIEHTLTSDEIGLLETEISPTLWYPIACLERLLLLLRDVEGAGRDDYFVEMGRDSAHEILDARSIKVVLTGARAFGRRAGAALIRIAALALNVGDWRYEGDDLSDFEVVVDDAAEIPDALRLNIQGFIEVLATQFAGQAVQCTSERTARDRILYRGVAAPDAA